MPKTMYVPNMLDFVTHYQVSTKTSQDSKKHLHVSKPKPIYVVSSVQATVDRAVSELRRMNKPREYGIIGGSIEKNS